MHFVLLSVCVAAALFGCGPSVKPVVFASDKPSAELRSQDEATLALVSANAKAATVRISSFAVQTNGGKGFPSSRMRHSTGVIVDRNGPVVLTSYSSLVRTGGKFAWIPGHGSVSMQVVQYDEQNDLALLAPYFTFTAEQVTAATLATTAPAASSLVYVGGGHDGLHFSQYVPVKNCGCHGMPAHQFAVEPVFGKGLAGAPVFDADGRLLGIVSFTRPAKGEKRELMFANAAYPALKHLLNVQVY